MPGILKEVTFRQQLDEPLPLDAQFKDESGRDVRLGDYFKSGKPVVLAFVYYQCPMLCTQVMNGISSALKPLTFTPGQDFDVVLVSFDPRDTPAGRGREEAGAPRVLVRCRRTAGGWHFLTGDEAEIRRVDAGGRLQLPVGRARRSSSRTSSGVLVITPDGRLSRYFYGVEYSPKELRLALVESGEGAIGSTIDELLLYCFHYDPEIGRYGVVVMNLIRLGGVVTVALLAGFILLMRRRETRTPAEGRA